MDESQDSLYLALDVGGSNVEAGLVTGVGLVLSTNTVASHPGGDREQVLADIALALEPFRGEGVNGLGAGFPAFGDYDWGLLDSELSAYPSMHRFPLRDHLERTYGVVTRLVPDANLLAHGLLEYGEGRDLDSFVAIGLGTGAAVSLVRDGAVATGPRGFPDEIMRFYTDWGWPDAWRHSGYRFAEHYGADSDTVYRRACDGDPDALDVWEQVGEALGDTITRLAAETQTSNAVVAGGLAAAWGFMEPAVRHRTEPEAVAVVRTSMPHPSLSGAAALFHPSWERARRPLRYDALQAERLADQDDDAGGEDDADDALAEPRL